jgi:enterochelin esterase-like enzyme
MTSISALILCATVLSAAQPYYDRTHQSKVFGEPRNYRIFLPPSYERSEQRYPVIYYFHGHSDRYTLEKYDNGLDTVPKIAAFVALHDAIVVAMDGYVARDYTGFYGGTPYDVREEGGEYDFGEYFRELTHDIDATYRTLTDRRHRATSGLSMGGFMSLYLSARYPELIGSASSFNPGPEFYIGEKGRRSLWRPKDHVLSHEQTMIRLIRATGDYISQYHEETRAAYASMPTIDFEYRADEYHRHWATSIGETFEFHMRAFENPALDVIPVEWNYTSAYRNFDVRGYHVESDSRGPGLLYLEHVNQGGLRIRTRRWAPDGPPDACSAVQIATAPLYRPGATYQVLDYDLGRETSSTRETAATNEGRLSIRVDCGSHELGIAGPGTGAQSVVLLPVTRKDYLRLPPDKAVTLPIRVFNPRGTSVQNVRADLTSAYPTVEIFKSHAVRSQVGAGQVADMSSEFQIRLHSGEGDFTRARVEIKLAAEGKETKQNIDILVAPSEPPKPLEVAILDGRKRTFPVFRQKGNQGGGASTERTVTEGKGNGNGVLEPGEQATIWVKLKQGVDAFDKNNWCRAKVFSDSPWLAEIGDIQETKQLEWTSGQSRTSLLELSLKVPPGTEIPMLLDCESWSFHFTPDVRYGKEPLYQAFQIHKHHIFSLTWSRP